MSVSFFFDRIGVFKTEPHSVPLPDIQLSPEECLRLMAGGPEQKFAFSNLICEPTLAALWDPDLSRWEMKGSQCIPGTDAVWNGRPFEFKNDTGRLPNGSISPNLFIETQKKNSENLYIDSGINVVPPGEGAVYGIYHAAERVAFYFAADKLRAALEKKQITATGHGKRKGCLIRAFDKGEIPEEIIGLCEKIIVISKEGRAYDFEELRGTPLEEGDGVDSYLKNPIVSRINCSSPTVALDRDTFSLALDQGCGIELETPLLPIKKLKFSFRELQSVEKVHWKRNVVSISRDQLPTFLNCQKT